MEGSPLFNLLTRVFHLYPDIISLPNSPPPPPPPSCSHVHVVDLKKKSIGTGPARAFIHGSFLLAPVQSLRTHSIIFSLQCTSFHLFIPIPILLSILQSSTTWSPLKFCFRVPSSSLTIDYAHVAYVYDMYVLTSSPVPPLASFRVVLSVEISDPSLDFRGARCVYVVHSRHFLPDHRVHSTISSFAIS